MKLESNIEPTAKWLNSVMKEVPFAVSLAINGALYRSMLKQREYITKIFTPAKTYTINAALYKKSTKRTAGVLFLKTTTRPGGNAPVKYLRYHIKGVARSNKKVEGLASRMLPSLKKEVNMPKLIPNFTVVKTDSYGNMRRSDMLDTIHRAAIKRGAISGRFSLVRSRRAISDKETYFAGKYRSKNGKYFNGIFKRTEKSGVRAVMFAVPRAEYKKVYDFYGHGEADIMSDFKLHINDIFISVLKKEGIFIKGVKLKTTNGETIVDMHEPPEVAQ